MERVLTANLQDLRRDRTSVKWRVFEGDVLPAWVAEMDAEPCLEVVEAVTAAMQRGDTGYTWAAPYAEALADFAVSRWSWQLDPAQLVPVPDVMIGVLEMIRVFTDPGDAVVVSPPVYDSFFGFIASYGRRLITAPLTSAGRLDETTLDRAFGEATAGGAAAAYLLCNPQNPTGTVHTREELSMLARVADAHGVRVISDEIHAPLVLSGTGFTPYLSVPGGQRGIALHSASKAWNLAGLKAALAVPGEEARDDLARMPEVATHGASHVAVIAHAAAISRGGDWLDRLIGELRANRDRVASRLGTQLPSAAYQPGEATYLAWLDLRALGLGDDPAEVLRERGRVALGSGPRYGQPGRGFARLNFATSPEVL
ncbi:MAG: MalY/PatB family protein, partial [Nostocoides sp.]